jgi:hypothetical protein
MPGEDRGACGGETFSQLDKELYSVPVRSRSFGGEFPSPDDPGSGGPRSFGGPGVSVALTGQLASLMSQPGGSRQAAAMMMGPSVATTSPAAASMAPATAAMNPAPMAMNPSTGAMNPAVVTMNQVAAMNAALQAQAFHNRWTLGSIYGLAANIARARQFGRM